MPPLTQYAPGLAALLHYKLADAPADLKAGLAVTAVALPVGIAYAELAGFRPEVGLYSSILPLVAYAIFGTSRQLIVGPDAATCALVAASVAPLAAGDQATYASLSVILALLTGVLCIAASFLRLGALADFLSRPILVGFLNGVALSIILGQADKIFGFPVIESGILPRLSRDRRQARRHSMADALRCGWNVSRSLDCAALGATAPRGPCRHGARWRCGSASQSLRVRRENHWIRSCRTA